MLANDFDTFAAYFEIPHFISTSDNKASIETIEEFRDLFDRTHEDFRVKRITDLIRICDVSEYRSPTQIGSTHTTHMMCGAQRVHGPFPCFSTLEHINGEWKITSSQYAVDKKLGVGAALNAQSAITQEKQTKVRNEE
ncbi:hypothetical protein Z949_2827 [Sulfitobacter guttiformis KCTC 32187]|nr:hypothetical protein Z949_2827 [Sulfitobacter guttiformis KCTC 32187]